VTVWFTLYNLYRLSFICHFIRILYLLLSMYVHFILYRHDFQLFPNISIFNILECRAVHWSIIPLLKCIPTAWSPVHLEKPPVDKLLKNIRKSYGTRRLISMLATSLHWSLSIATWIHSIQIHPVSLIFIFKLSSHLCLGLPSGLFPRFVQSLYVLMLHRVLMYSIFVYLFLCVCMYAK
jgi:hypothetical protein